MANMQERWLKAKEWWATLAAREQQGVALGGGLVIVFILYQFIWSPYLDHVDSMRKQLITAEKNLVWMTAADKEIKKIESQAVTKEASVSPVVLLSYLQKKLNQAGLAPTELKQSGNDAVEIHFQKVDFDKLVKLLTQVVKEQPVYITQMSATGDAAPGIVGADVMLKLG